MSYDQTDQDQLYIEDGYFTPDGYYVYIAEAKVDLTPYIDEGYIDANYYEFYGGFATLTAELTLVEGELKEAEAQLSSTASISAVASVTRTVASAVSAQVTQTAVASRTQEGASAVSAQVTQTTQAIKTVSANINAGALFTPSITVEAVKNMTAVIDCVSTITADTQATKVFNITLSSIVTQSLQGVYTADGVATIASAFTSTAITDVVKEYSSNQSSEFTQTVSADKLKRAESSIIATASLSANIRIGNDRPLNVSQSSNVSIDTGTKQFGLGSLSATNGSLAYYAGNEQVPSGTSYVSAWVKPAFTPQTGRVNSVVSLRGAVSGYGLAVPYELVVTHDYKLRLNVWTTAQASPNYTITTTNTLSTTQFNHVAFSRNANTTALWLNGQRQGTVTISDSWLSFDDYVISPLLLVALRAFTSSRDNWTGFIDELEMQNGSYGIYNPANTTYTQPTQASANNESNTRFLFHYDVDFSDDNSRQGAAAFTVSATQTAQTVITASAVSTQSSQFTQTASATKTIDASANLSAQFNQSVSAEDIDLAEIALLATFTLQAQVDDLDIAAASLSSEFTLAVSTDKLKGAVINVGAMFTPTIDCVATRVGDIDLISTFTSNIVANYKVAGNVSVTAQTQISSNSGYLIKNSTQVIRSRSKMRMEGFTWYNQPVTPPDLSPRPRNLTGTATFTTGKYSQSLLLDNSPQVTRQDAEFNYNQWGRIDLWYSPGNGIDSTGFGQTILEYSDGSTVSWRLKTVEISSTDYRFRFEWFQSDGTFRSLTSSSAIWTSSSDNTFKRFYVQKLDTTATISNNISVSDITGNIYITTDAPRYLANATLKFGGADRIDRIDELIFFKDTVKDALPNNVLSDNPFKLSSQTNVIALYHFDNNLIDDTGIINVAQMDVDSGTLLEIAEIQYLYTGRANLQTTSTQTTNARKQIGVICNNSSQFNLTADIKRTRTVNSAMSTVSSISCSISRIRYADSQLTNNIVMSTEAYDFTKASADLAVVATQTAQAYDFTKTGAELFVDCLITPTATRIFQLDSEFDAIASNIAVAAKTGQGLVTVEVVAQLNASAIKNATITENLSSQSTIVANAISNVIASANISASATQTTLATKFRPAQANLSSNFAITIHAVKTTDVTSNNTSEFTQTTVNDRLRDNASTQTSAFTQNTVGLRVKLFTVNVNTNASILATAFTLVKFQANITSMGFVVTAGDVEHIDPYYTYMIEQETRQFQIDEEPRLYAIDPETRVNIIKGSLL